LRDRFQADVELLPSGGGVFEVVVDGRLVHSKKTSGEFPDHEELLGRVGG
jgi:selenoprotein W-related protein